MRDVDVVIMLHLQRERMRGTLLPSEHKYFQFTSNISQKAGLCSGRTGYPLLAELAATLCGLGNIWRFPLIPPVQSRAILLRCARLVLAIRCAFLYLCPV